MGTTQAVSSTVKKWQYLRRRRVLSRRPSICRFSGPQGMDTTAPSEVLDGDAQDSAMAPAKVTEELPARAAKTTPTAMPRGCCAG